MNDEYSFSSKFYDPFLFPALRGIRNNVTEELYPSKHKKILDLCCGTGNQMKILENKGFSDLHCLDISKSMLAIARKNNPKYSIYERDATKTEFEPESFDIVILSFAIHEKSSDIQEKIVNEAYRILNNEGTLLVVDYIFDSNTFFAAKWGVSIIERIAGKDHYKNFKAYIKNGGLNSIVKKDRWKMFKETRHIFNSIALSQFKKTI